MPDVTPLVTTNNGDFYTQNAQLALPVFPNTSTNHPCQVDPRNHSSGSGPTGQPPHTKTTGSCPRTRSTRVRASRAPDLALKQPSSTGAPHREQKLVLRKACWHLAPMLNKNLSRPGRRFHPHSPPTPGELAPMCRRESFRAIQALNKRLGFRPPRYARPAPAGPAPLLRAPRTHSVATPLPLAVRKEGARREWRLARCRWFGGHPRRRRTCLCAVVTGGLRMHAALASPAGRAHQHLPPPLPTRTGRAPRLCVRACDASLCHYVASPYGDAMPCPGLAAVWGCQEGDEHGRRCGAGWWWCLGVGREWTVDLVEVDMVGTPPLVFNGARPV
jgi:hypothetical protein